MGTSEREFHPDEDAKKIIKATMEEQWANNKENILNNINISDNKFEFELKPFSIFVLLDVYKDNTKIPDLIEYTNNGLILHSWNDEIIDAIIEKIPKSITYLKLNENILKERPNILDMFPNLETLELDAYTTIKQSFIDTVKKYPNVKNIKVRGTSVYELRYSSNINLKKNTIDILDGNKATIILDKEDDSSFTYNGDIDKIGDFLEEVPEQNVSLYIGGKRIIDHRVSTSGNSTDFIISDPIRESYKLLTTFIEKTNIKIDNLHLVMENKSYSDLISLDLFEKLGKVDVEYDHSARCTILEFEQMRATLDYFVYLIKQNNLSPLEQLCYAYDLIKSNAYEEDESNLYNSRHIAQIVSTGKIVCVGYAVFLAELLKELGIEAHAIGTKVPIDGEEIGHERNIVEIHDEKYGVDGMFALDCTWDSNRELYRVIRDGEEKIVYEIKEGDEFVEELDKMSRYNHFLIPAQEYEYYFPGEPFYRNVNEWRGQLYDPNKAAIQSLDEKRDETIDEDVFEDNTSIDEDMIISIIYTTRMYEGYSQEQNDRLIEQVKELRKRNKPKELRSEQGMTK